MVTALNRGVRLGGQRTLALVVAAVFVVVVVPLDFFIYRTLRRALIKQGKLK